MMPLRATSARHLRKRQRNPSLAAVAPVTREAGFPGGVSRRRGPRGDNGKCADRRRCCIGLRHAAMLESQPPSCRPPRSRSIGLMSAHRAQDGGCPPFYRKHYHDDAHTHMQRSEARWAARRTAGDTQRSGCLHLLVLNAGRHLESVPVHGAVWRMAQDRGALLTHAPARSIKGTQSQRQGHTGRPVQCSHIRSSTTSPIFSEQPHALLPSRSLASEQPPMPLSHAP